MREYDQYSLREFLEVKGFSEGAIEMYGVMNFVESDMNNAVRRGAARGPGQGLRGHAGDRGRHRTMLPRAFYGELQDRIRFGAEVFAIDQDADSVTVHFKTEAGRYTERGDYAICAIPFSVLRQIEVADPVLAREAAGDPPAELLGLDQDPVPGPRARLGDR